MNLAEEVLCADKFNRIKCKPLSKIGPTDKILFKAVDLADPSNPGELTHQTNELIVK
jgi:hypothetical protein